MKLHTHLWLDTLPQKYQQHQIFLLDLIDKRVYRYRLLQK